MRTNDITHAIFVQLQVMLANADVPVYCPRMRGIFSNESLEPTTEAIKGAFSNDCGFKASSKGMHFSYAFSMRKERLKSF